MLLFEKGLHLRLQLGVVHRDRDQLEIAVADAAGERDEFGKLRDTGRAPSGPDVDEAEAVGVVLRQLGHACRIDQLEIDRLRFPFLLGLGDVVALGVPLRRAAHDDGLRRRDGLAGEQLDHGVAGVVRGHRLRILEARVVHAADVTELALPIEEEDVGRREAAIGLGGGLRVTVVEIRKRETRVARVELHLRVAVVVFAVAELIDADAVGAVGVDGNDVEALRLELLRERDETRLRGVRVRTVVGEEDHHEELRSLVVGEGVRLAVDAEELEVGSGVTELERAGVGGKPARDFAFGGRAGGLGGTGVRRALLLFGVLGGGGECERASEECGEGEAEGVFRFHNCGGVAGQRPFRIYRRRQATPRRISSCPPTGHARSRRIRRGR